MRHSLLLLLLCAPSAAGEYAVLESGFRLKIDHHERVGSQIRLFTTKDGFMDLPASSVAAIEAEEFVPPEPVAATVPIAAPAAAPPIKPNAKELVRMAAIHHGLPPEFLDLVVNAESGYRQDAISSKGAIGMMQLMPQTAAALKADPHDPGQNVEAGTRYLRSLLVQYENYPDQLRRALAAYNAGPGAVQKYNGVPPYRETQLYVEKIVGAYRRTLKQQPDAR